MTSRDFCYWLQGAFEVAGVNGLSAEQTEVVKRHLSLVFVHEIDPSMGDAKEQAKLNAVHGKPAQSQVFPGNYQEPPKMRC